MKRRALSLSLSLLLMAGCAPAPEPSPTAAPTASQSPEPVSFDAFLAGVNEARRSALEGGEPMDISAWTSDFREQNDTFTEAEMERLLTPHNLEKALTMETAREDIETFFTLLRTTYGAYDYFGGDEVFGPLEEQAIAALESGKEEGDILYSKEIRDILYDTVSPVIRDGHFMIGEKHLIEEVRQEPYYVPDQYIADPEAEGLDPAYVKPTIGPDGAITYGFFALSHDGSDLPETLGGYTLDWQPCGMADLEEPEPFVFAERAYEGLPMLVSRKMSPYEMLPESEAELERFASCGGEYADAPVLLFDVRRNPGGSDRWIMDWFEGWTGQPCASRRVWGHRYSQLSCKVFSYYPEEQMGTWRVVQRDEGTWVPREGVTFLLTDKGTASSGETVVEFLHSVENVLVVGAPSSGCSLVSSNWHFYLPNTGIEVYFGTGLSFCEAMENRDGVGFLPDLWVNPTEAPAAVARLCAYYGLNPQ